MENEKIKEIVSSVLPDDIICYDVNNVNHKPHPYTIGAKHIAHAEDNHGGMLGVSTLNKVKCAHPHCNLSYDEHTADKVIFLQLKNNVSQEFMQKAIEKIVEALPDKSFDGFSFIETEQKFRII